jgi:two-component system sensor histidine kinase DegS
VAGSSDRIAAALAQTEEELARLDRELSEIALLDQQARAESTRHELKRGQAGDRLAALQARHDVDPAEIRDATAQLMTLTRRSALMEAQVDILEGKQKALARFRDRAAALSDALRPTAEEAEAAADEPDVATAASLARAIMTAQEDLRRDIARAMHDGPAQSLTNIILQAQIVERLVAQDPARVAIEASRLVEMVQRTLEATKAFIFEVRPMVLDDLGLVPTLRRSARDRGRRARVPIDFESLGPDRRLVPELESAIYRIVDEAVSGFMETEPSRLTIRLDWSTTDLHARIRAVRTEETALAMPAGGVPPVADDVELGTNQQGDDLPPALAAMIKEQREGAAAARTAAIVAAVRATSLPAQTWREIQQRAATSELAVALLEDGRALDVTAIFAARSPERVTSEGTEHSGTGST